MASSNWVHIDSDVIWGTVLGLLLLYINQMPKCISKQITVRLFADCCIMYRNIKIIQDHTQEDSRLKTQKYLFDHYLNFLKLHVINNNINSLFIWSRRLPLRPCVVAGRGATFMETKIHIY